MSDFEIIRAENTGIEGTKLRVLSNSNKDNLIINITPPNDGPKRKLRILCLMDRSQSMISPITYQTTDGNKEDDGLTRIDLAIHTYKTLVKTMPEDTEFGLISFNSKSKLLMPLTKMTSDNKNIAIENADKLLPTGMTNLWEPIEEALNIFRLDPRDDTTDVIIMMTDGEPTNRPIRGEVNEMKEHINKNFTNTPYFIPIGFTNGQDSSLLTKLADLTNEIVYYISDASMMGTVFINTLSYILSLSGTNLSVTLTTENATKINPNLKYLYPNAIFNETQMTLNIGSIGYGLTRNIVIPIKCDDETVSIKVELTYTNANNDKCHLIESEVSVTDNTMFVKNQLFRMNFVSTIKNVLVNIHSPEDCKKYLMDFLSQVRDNKTPDNLYLEGIESDCIEAIKAITPEYIKTWGQHYINALMLAHLNERCTNFKDEGVKFYSSTSFETYRKTGEKIFNEIDIDKHTFSTYVNEAYNFNGVMMNQSNNKPRKMKLYGRQSNYLKQSNGCVMPNTMITLKHNIHKKAKDIRKGDILKTMNGYTSVICVVKFKTYQNMADMVKVNDLVISPYHPVYINNRWVFPKSLGKIYKEQTSYVYNFVLSSEGTIYANDVIICTLGHGLTTDIVRHEYLGTQRIINDLSRINGWKQGIVELPPMCFRRDKHSNQIASLKSNGVNN
jgi:uncharacterized protein YegL